MSKLDDIFDGVLEVESKGFHGDKTPDMYTMQDRENLDNAIDEAVQEVKTLMLELVGKDESELEEVNPGFYGAQIRNAQRAIQRQGVKQL